MSEYLKFYDLENYLLGEVRGRFRRSQELRPLDLFLILHWKAPRAKTKQRDRLKDKAGSFEQATKCIAGALNCACNAEERMKVLILDWKFELPTATAILTILYPEEFTVYDVRVRNQLGLAAIATTRSQARWKDFWQKYCAFKEAVIRNTPEALTLRDKDRYLWGKSLYEDSEDCWRA
jgi:hypothetical protein